MGLSGAPVSIEGSLDTSKRDALKRCKQCQGFVSVVGAGATANITVLCQRGGVQKQHECPEGVCHASLVALAKHPCPNYLRLTKTLAPEMGQSRTDSPPAPHSP